MTATEPARKMTGGFPAEGTDSDALRLRTDCDRRDGLVARYERDARKLKTDLGHGPAPAVRKILVKALKAYKRGDFGAAALRALEATRIDENCAQGYHALALALEGLGELHKALTMYERALKLDPTDPEIYLNLGLVAWKLRMFEGAEKFFRLYSDMRPDHHSGYNNLGGVLRDQGRYDDAIETLRGAIHRMPEQAELWNTLGTVAVEQGSIAESRAFYAEALRLSPRMARAYHNIAYAVSHTGPLDEALCHYDKAIKLTRGTNDLLEMRHGRALCLLGLGRLAEGWAEWEVRHDPRFRGSLIYALNVPRWQGEALEGKRLVIMGEQGLGDEIMFASGYRELCDQIGPDGKLMIACDLRLAPLFQRSFPKAEIRGYVNKRHNGKGVRVLPWLCDVPPVDLFSPNGSTLRFVRPDITSFSTTEPLLVPDPDRVAYWQEKLRALGPGPFVGVCWRSMVATGARAKYFSPMEAFEPVFKTAGVTFVNLQYGDSAADRAFAKERFGVEIHDFAELDLKDALDDNAALCAALDLVLSAPTAAGALAGAVGTEVWLLAIGYVWPMLGTPDRFPWFVNSRVLMPPEYADWPALMDNVGRELAAFAQR